MVSLNAILFKNWVRACFVVCISSALLFCIVFTGVAYTNHYLNVPPESFPIETTLEIREGMSVSETTKYLANQQVIRSPLYLYFVLTTYFPETYIQAGSYHFDTPLPAFEIAKAITAGEYQIPSIRITFPEGFRSRDILDYIPTTLTLSSTTDLTHLEGYLFPDTYFVAHDTTLEDIISLMQKTFEEKTAPFAEKIAASGFTKDQVIILASLIEREAKNNESKKMVSGILQNRLRNTMPLQVDAVFDYILNKTSKELTLDDLASDTPYNTYLHIGLPPAPISNPGIESIQAVLEPTSSDYIYYLTGTDGTFHYAKTFDEHKTNKERYLR